MDRRQVKRLRVLTVFAAQAQDAVMVLNELQENLKRAPRGLVPWRAISECGKARSFLSAATLHLEAAGDEAEAAVICAEPCQAASRWRRRQAQGARPLREAQLARCARTPARRRCAERTCWRRWIFEKKGRVGWMSGDRPRRLKRRFVHVGGTCRGQAKTIQSACRGCRGGWVRCGFRASGHVGDVGWLDRAGAGPMSVECRGKRAGKT